MDTTDVVCHRLKDYKRTSKETKDVKSTRKLLAGIKLRRDRRENEVVWRSRPLIRHFILLGRRKGLGTLLFGNGEMSDVEPDTFTE